MLLRLKSDPHWPSFPASMAEQDVQYRDDKVAEKQTASPGSSSDNEEVGTTSLNENALLRKIDLRLLPAVGILYLLSFLDRSNVANARIEGLADDLGMTGNQCKASSDGLHIARFVDERADKHLNARFDRLNIILHRLRSLRDPV